MALVWFNNDLIINLHSKTMALVWCGNTIAYSLFKNNLYKLQTLNGIGCPGIIFYTCKAFVLFV